MNKVYGVLLSPFVRKVIMTLEYKNIPYESVFTMPGNSKPEFLAISPLGKVPAFQDEYINLADSTVICQYINDKYPTPSIYPNNPQEKARALWLEEFADTKLGDLLGAGIFYEIIVAPNSLGRPTDYNKVNATKKILPQYLSYLEKQVHGNNYLIGGQLSIADLTIPALFMNAQYSGYEVDKFSFPKLSAYLAFMWNQPLYQKRFAAEKDLLAGLLSKKTK